MDKDPDEEALSWAGETDPTHVDSPVPSSGRAEKRPKAGSQVEADQSSANPVSLVVFGILAGVYLLYVIGWVIFGFTSKVPVQGVFFSIMYQVGVALAIASPILWAAAVWMRVKKPVWRMLWLFAGVLVLVPWPFIVGGLG